MQRPQAHDRYRMPGPPRIAFTRESSVFLAVRKCVRFITDAATPMALAVYFPALRAVHLAICWQARGRHQPGHGLCARRQHQRLARHAGRSLKLDLDTVIPGHGSVMNKAGLLAHRNKIEAIRAGVSGMIHDGKIEG